MGPESVIGFSSDQETKQYSLYDNSMLLSFSKPYIPLYFMDPSYDFSKDFSFALTQQAGNAYLHMSFSNQLNSSHQALGYTSTNLGLTFLHGEGDGMLSSRYSVNGIAPNFFHGSVLWPYEYSGASLVYSLTNNLRVHSGNVIIESPNLETRTVYYGGFDYKNLSGTIATVKLDNDTIGHRFFIAYKWHSQELAYQEYDSTQNSRWREVGLTFKNDGPGSWHLNLGQGTNDFYKEAAETRVMLTFKIPLGGDELRTDLETSDNFKQNSTIAYVADQFSSNSASAVSALSTGLIMSSGSPTLDSSYRFDDQTYAAYYILTIWNPVSVSENREYGSIIYRNRDMTYSPSSSIVKGTVDSVSFNPYSLNPTGTTVTADWHTHGATMEGYLNEFFSTADISFSNYYQIDGYLGTPEGRMYLYDYSSGAIYHLVTPDYSQYVVLPN